MWVNMYLRKIFNTVYQIEKLTKAALHRCSYKNVFWKIAGNLQENTHDKVLFQ